MELFWLIIICFAYLLIGFFSEVLVSGEEYSDNFGLLLFLWPVVLAIFIIGIPFYGAHKLAMWVRKIFNKE